MTATTPRDDTRCPRRHTAPTQWLVEDGDLVSPGQPLVRLHPEGVPA